MLLTRRVFPRDVSGVPGNPHFRGPRAAGCWGGWLVLSLILTGGLILAEVVPFPVPPSGRGAGFTPVPAAAAGIQFTNALSPSRYLTNQIYLNGSGVCLGDVDGDGRPDLFLGGLGGASALYLNQGSWNFTDITRSALGGRLESLDVTGSALTDLDGDDDLELVVNTVGQGTWVGINDGRGRFQWNSLPINPGRAGMSLGIADADGDGDLDLYVVNYRPNSIRDDPTGKFTVRQEPTGPRVVTYNGRSTSEPDLVGRFYVTPAGVKENGEPDVLLLNDGAGGFSTVSWTDGAFRDDEGRPLQAPPYDWGLSVLFRDLTGDGRPDLYLSNDFESPDRFWINETPRGGPLRFRAAPAMALRHLPAFSMGVDAADVNRDGIDDFLVLDMLSRDHAERNRQSDGLPPSRHAPGVWEDRPQFSQNAFFLGRGDGTFAEIGRLAGLAASEWSWTPIFLDVDLDGWEDLLVSNGHELDMMDGDIIQQAEVIKGQRRMSARELQDLRKLFGRYDAADAAFRNRGDLSFSDESQNWGVAQRNVTHGMAVADLDGDGDLDVVQNNLNAPPTLLRNEATAPRIAVRLKAAGRNTRGIGARIRVLGGAVPDQSQVLLAGGRYLSSDDPIRVFAAGTASTVTVQVRWPSGALSEVTGVPAGSLVRLAEGESAVPATLPSPAGEALMEDVSESLGHRSVETPFQDFERQPLLPWSLAYPTPGVTWADLDGDGSDALVLGSGAGGTLSIHRFHQGAWSRWTNGAVLKPLGREVTTVLALDRTLIAGSSNYRDGRTNGGLLRLFDLERQVSGESLLGKAMSAGPLAMGDVDGDGLLDLFVGGRAVAGRYPEAAPSLLLRNTGGRFEVKQQFAGDRAVGLVNGATLTDLDHDGDPDLLMAVEWGPVRVWRNTRGTFEPWDPAVRGAGLGRDGVRLSDLTGWWTSVAVGDFDGDGRLDWVVGNRGWNWFPVPHAPMRSEDPANRRYLRAAELAGSGTVAVLESYLVGGREVPVRRADVLFEALPQLRELFPTRAALGAAAIPELVAALKLPPEAPRLEAGWFATTLFLNRGDHLEVRPLPVEAQSAPVSGLSVADFDGDGHPDVFLAQNFFPVRPDEVPQDAGCGLLLRGNGDGTFENWSATQSGIRVWGDARGSAVGDFDRDGRPDLAVAQNGGATRLFRNRLGRPGLSVRLNGPPENPRGIGAQLRLRAGDWGGPVQEVQAGTGWLSVDSPRRILTSDRVATEVELRWPGRPAVRVAIPAGARVLELTPDGEILRAP